MCIRDRENECGAFSTERPAYRGRDQRHRGAAHQHDGRTELHVFKDIQFVDQIETLEHETDISFTHLRTSGSQSGYDRHHLIRYLYFADLIFLV